MKQKIALSLFFILLINGILYSQCEDKDFFFNLRAGMNRFDATTAIALNKNITSLRSDGSNEDANMYYEFNNHSCINGDNHTIRLSFKKGRLWSWDLKISFATTALNECVDNYNRIINAYKKQYPIHSDGYVGSEGIENRQEKTGELYTFYKSQEIMNEMNDLKEGETKDYEGEYYTVSYRFDYEVEYNRDKKEWLRTGKIRGCIIELVYMNTTFKSN